ncbi:50S ribosomal protein L10 [Candidatus Peregrinibacteria bacterium]|nr:50S ribosomal protein L10 [Candidatus Peregrinibacteria bacterium]
MALTKQQKTEQLRVLKEKFTKASSVIFAHYIGLTVSEVSDLRRKLKKSGAEMKVAKKTLMKLAAKELSMPAPTDELMEGPVACIFSYSDPVSGAQTAFTYAKDHQQVSLLGGIFEGKLLSKFDAKVLATIPGRQVLLATFAGMIRSPLVSFASMCDSPFTGFARLLSEIAKKKQPAIA